MTTIMVIEDEKTSRFLLRRILTGHGYTVIAADSGLAALQLLGEQVPDIIISDIMMPGMDGLEFAERVRQNQELKDIPIIMCTAMHDRETVLRAIELGVAQYIVKPVLAEGLLQDVERLIKNSKHKPGENTPPAKEYKSPAVKPFAAELPDYIISMREYLAIGSIYELKKDASEIAAKAVETGAGKLAWIAGRIAEQGGGESPAEDVTQLLDELEQAAEAFLLEVNK